MEQKNKRLNRIKTTGKTQKTGKKINTKTTDHDIFGVVFRCNRSYKYTKTLKLKLMESLKLLKQYSYFFCCTGQVFQDQKVFRSPLLLDRMYSCLLW